MATRRGTPLTVYFSPEQTESLNILARQRHVSKSTVVRLAVEHLMRQLASGQLQLPLGIQDFIQHSRSTSDR